MLFGEKPITKDKQMKTLYHIKAGRESRGGARGLAGFPWAAAEVPEGYFSGWEDPPEKCEV